MSKSQTLRGLINQRLSAAAEEIFELFERTIAEYEEQLCRSKESQRRLLDAAFNPEVRLYKADVLRLLVQEEPAQKRSSPEPAQVKEELFKKQEGEQLQRLEQDNISKFTFNPVPVKTGEDGGEGRRYVPSLLQHQTKEEQKAQDPVVDQEDKPEPPHIKEEWDLFQVLEDADIKPLFTPVPVKTEEDDNEEKPQFPWLHPNQTEENKGTEAESEDCGGSEEIFSEFDTDYSVVWEETGETQPGSQQNKGAPVSEMDCNTGEALVNDSKRAKRPKGKKKKSDRIYDCKVCGKTYRQKRFYRRHYTRFHLIGPKHFPCSLCKKKFRTATGLINHMREHTGERPYKCSQCEKAFKRQRDLQVHITYHTGEKPYTCPICQKGFRSHVLMTQHRKTHTGEVPTCSLCQITFRTKKKYYKHMRTHAREKPFGCSVCEKGFSSKETLMRHMTTHKREESLSCSVCNKSYTASYIKNHKCKMETVKPDRVWCTACNKNFTASYHKYHKCKAKEGKTNEAAEERLNLSKQQGSADHSQEVSDQHVVPSSQNSSDQQQMFQPGVIQRSPVITTVGSHFNLLEMQNYTEPQMPSVDLS